MASRRDDSAMLRPALRLVCVRNRYINRPPIASFLAVDVDAGPYLPETSNAPPPNSWAVRWSSLVGAVRRCAFPGDGRYNISGFR